MGILDFVSIIGSILSATITIITVFVQTRRSKRQFISRNLNPEYIKNVISFSKNKLGTSTNEVKGANDDNIQTNINLLKRINRELRLFDSISLIDSIIINDERKKYYVQIKSIDKQIKIAHDAVASNSEELIKLQKLIDSINTEIPPTPIIESKVENMTNKNEAIISTLFLKEKLKNIYSTYFILVCSAILSIVFSNIISTTIFGYVTSGLLVMSFLYHFTLRFRIKNGLFGTNFYEAKELLGYILTNIDKFKDDQGRKIFHSENLNDEILKYINIAERRSLENARY